MMLRVDVSESKGTNEGVEVRLNDSGWLPVNEADTQRSLALTA
jgi:hypothetical protein